MSTITSVSSLIDPQFPVPGQDNDTQGFRDNFGNIQEALNRAAAEITDLQVINSALVSTVSDGPSSSVGKDGDRKGNLFANSTTVAIAYSGYVGNTVSIWNIIDTRKIDNSLQWKTSAPLSSTGTVGDVRGMIHATSQTLYICFQDYNSSTTTNIWSRVSLTTGW